MQRVRPEIGCRHVQILIPSRPPCIDVAASRAEQILQSFELRFVIGREDEAHGGNSLRESEYRRVIAPHDHETTPGDAALQSFGALRTVRMAVAGEAQECERGTIVILRVMRDRQRFERGAQPPCDARDGASEDGHLGARNAGVRRSPNIDADGLSARRSVPG